MNLLALAGPAPRRTLLACLPLVAALPSCADSTGVPDITDPRLSRAVVAAEAHTCALAGDGTTYCWGDGQEGQLGDGAREGSLRPVATDGPLLAFLAAGMDHTCGLAADGAAYCWGRNLYGETGDGSNSARGKPVAVQGGLRFSTLTAGFTHTCGLTLEGAVYCWGGNFEGQAGADFTKFEVHAPEEVEVPGEVVGITAGGAFTCAWTRDGGAWCWGENRNGQLGDGSRVQHGAPTRVDTEVAFTWLGGGFAHTCGLDGEGRAWCWGGNFSGQVGNGEEEDVLRPTAVGGGAPAFASLSVGGSHACGVTGEDRLWCWGSNLYGSLGLGDAPDPREAVPVLPDFRFRSVALGMVHACGRTPSGVLYCWGDNAYGQLGDGSGALGWHTPVLVRW